MHTKSDIHGEGTLQIDGASTLTGVVTAPAGIATPDTLITRIYGDLYVQDNAVATAITTLGKANKVQFEGFDTNGLNAGVTIDHTENHILILLAGTYRVAGSATYSGVGGAKEYGVSFWRNDGDAEFPQIHTHRTLQAGGDTGSVSFGPGYVAFVAGETIELWVWNEDDASDPVISDAVIAIERMGA